MFSCSLFAQTIDKLAPSPADAIYDNLNELCGQKKVKQAALYYTKDGKQELQNVISYNSKGKIESNIFAGAGKLHHYYTYSGDTTIERIIGPSKQYTSSDTASMEVYIERYVDKEKVLVQYLGYYPNWADSMETPILGTYFNYENGLLTSVSAFGQTSEKYTYDSHKNLIEADINGSIQKYRRIYVGDKQTEVYFTDNKYPEYLGEKFYYDDKGMISKYETFDWNGVAPKTSTMYIFNDAKKLKSKIMAIGGESFTYDVSGRLIKDELIDVNGLLTTGEYHYNEKSLLDSITIISLMSKMTATYSYTYW
jgi:YD repeat-containing protein